VWVKDAELERIAQIRQEPLAEVVSLYTRLTPAGRRTLREKANGDCVFYERDQGCIIYSVRPRQCRTWPFWESNLASPAHWQRTCDVCPGAGQGLLIPAKEIARRIKVIRM
jgi:Fe-S-cluster containining protein